MSTIAGALLTIMVGLAAIMSTWTGTYANYVKVGLRWPLVIASLVLIAAGLASLAYAIRGRANVHSHGAQGVGALLLVFVVALVLAPPPLGAAAAADRTPNRAASAEAFAAVTTTAPPVAAEAEPPVEPSEPGNPTPATATEEPSVGAQSTSEQSVPSTAVQEGVLEGNARAISMYEFVGYALFAPELVVGQPFELVGFAAEEPDIGNSFRLTRYLMGCCAADAFPLQVTLVDPTFMPALDQWVVVQATFHGELTDIDEWGEGVPVLEVHEMAPIDPPAEPYES